MNTMRGLLAPVLLVLALSGCGDDGDGGGGGGEGDDQSVTLEVTVTDWNSWEENFKPRPDTTTVELTVGEDFVVDSFSGEVRFEVTTLTSDTIDFTLSQSLSPVAPSGGIVNGRDTRDEFSMSRDGTLRVGTPTFDLWTTITVNESERSAA